MTKEPILIQDLTKPLSTIYQEIVDSGRQPNLIPPEKVHEIIRAEREEDRQLIEAVKKDLAAANKL